MIETKTIPGKGVAVHTGVGVVVMQDVLGAIRRLHQDPTYVDDLPVIWDLSSAELGITLSDIIYIDQEVVGSINKSRAAGAKTAWIANTAFGESIIRLLYTSHEWSGEWKTFSSLESAFAWCAVDA